MEGQNGAPAAAAVPQIAPLAKYKLVFLGDQVISMSRFRDRWPHSNFTDAAVCYVSFRALGRLPSSPGSCTISSTKHTRYWGWRWACLSSASTCWLSGTTHPTTCLQLPINCRRPLGLTSSQRQCTWRTERSGSSFGIQLARRDSGNLGHP